MFLALCSAPAQAAFWEPRPGVTLPKDDGVSQAVELVDIDADGFVDLVFATSRGLVVGGQGDVQLNRIFHNDQGAGFTELFGVFDEPDNSHAIKAGDLDGDGDPDLVVAGNFNGQSYVLMRDGDAFTRQDIVLPQQGLSIGAIELGDVDGDGHLDVVAADWGNGQPYGDPDDEGASLRLWLGQGDGTFVDATADLPPGKGAVVAWSLDLELVDFDGDFDLDVLAASEGFGFALALRNDGGVFSIWEIPALKFPFRRHNEAFAVMDVDGDDLYDLIGLQDFTTGCVILDGLEVCGRRNSVLLGDGQGGFGDWTTTFWPEELNLPGLDDDVAVLDLDGGGTPDFLVVAERRTPSHINTRLLHNDGGLVASAEAFPHTPELERTCGVMIADFDHDRREDVAVAIRSDEAPSVVLFGRADGPEEVPEDDAPPSIRAFEALPAVVVAGEPIVVRARVDDHKTPTRWHDFLHDPDLDGLSLVDGAITAHRRRLPYLEFALGLAAPADIEGLADTDPNKTIVPGVWTGESLWTFAFAAPAIDARSETLTWRYCAIDAAANKACVGPFEIEVEFPVDCGDRLCEPPEDAASCPQDCACDDDGACEPGEGTGLCCDCANCDAQCGDGLCADTESPEDCPRDCPVCDDDGVCEAGEGRECADCSGVEDPCGDGVCADDESSADCPADCPQECGNCLCEPGEDPFNCPEDCAGVTGGECGPPTCGDGSCEDPEDPQSCPEDCTDIETTGSATGGGDSATGGGGDLEEAGCNCRESPATGMLGLLVLLGRRRRARR